MSASQEILPKCHLVKTETRTAVHNHDTINMPHYDVFVDDVKVGVVYRDMVTRERRTAGRRYVNARWRSPGWRHYDNTSRAYGSDSSRKAALRSLLTFLYDYTTAQKILDNM